MSTNTGIPVSQLILKEVDIVQSEIARFDNNCLTVRSWCLAAWSAVIAYGVDKDRVLIVSAAVVTTVGFAFIDLMYRRVQVRFILRSATLEQCLNTDLAGYEFGVHRTADGKLNDSRFVTEARIVFRHRYYWLFYLVLAICAAGGAIYVWLT